MDQLVFISSHWLQQRSLGAYVFSRRRVHVLSITWSYIYRFLQKCGKRRCISYILRMQSLVSFWGWFWSRWAGFNHFLQKVWQTKVMLLYLQSESFCLFSECWSINQFVLKVWSTKVRFQYICGMRHFDIFWISLKMSSPVSSRNVLICPMFSLCTFACEYLRFVNGFYRVDHKLIVFFLKCLKQRYVSPILRTQPFVSFSESFSTFRRHFLPKMCSFALRFPFARLLTQIVRIA